MHPAPIIDFWFTATKPRQWWTKDPQFDPLIAAKFRAITIRCWGGHRPRPNANSCVSLDLPSKRPRVR